MPAETIVAFQDHGKVVPSTITEGVAEARKVIERLAEIGVDYDDVVATLEAEGVQKFADSFEELLDGIRAKRAQLATA
jgi:transaldolase